MKAIGKFFKFIFWTVIVLVLLAVVAFLTLPWWVGPTVTGVANFAVPKVVKSDFALKRFEFNQYKGTFGMGGMTLANPEGFEQENCVELDALDVNFDPVSCFTKKIHIEKITLDGLRVDAEFPAGGNFVKIAENAREYCGGCEESAEEPTAEEPASEKEPVKVVIDLVEIKNLKVTYGAAPIVLPDFTLTDIGKESGGATAAEASKEIYKAVCDKCGIVVGAVLDAGKAVAETGAQAAGAVMDAGAAAASNIVNAVQSVDVSGKVDAMKDRASDTVGAVKSGVGTMMDAVGNGASGAAGMANDAAQKVGSGISSAAGAVGDAASKGLNAVGDGIGAAVDRLKGNSK